MWNLLMVTAIVVNLGEAQRSSYAPRPGSNSKLLPRYRTNNTNSVLGSRGGEEDSSSSTFFPDLQGTLEDQKFVHRVSQWPEDRQPFWYKNRYAISSMRDRNIDGGNSDRTNFETKRPIPQFQSSFQRLGGDRGRDRGRAASQANDLAQFRENYAFQDFVNDPLLLYLQRVHNI